MERETGFEPATPSLEGWRSTAELFPRIDQHGGPEMAPKPPDARAGPGKAVAPLEVLRSVLGPDMAPKPSNTRQSIQWWGGEDLNPRRRLPADLQSAPFGHLGISPLVLQTVTP